MHLTYLQQHDLQHLLLFCIRSAEFAQILWTSAEAARHCLWRCFSKTADSSNAHVCRVTKSECRAGSASSWSPAIHWSMKTTCGWWSRKRLAGSYMEPSPIEWILPLQACMWFLSSPSRGPNLTEFPTVHFRRRNMFPTATNSLWQTVACVSLGFPQTISWFVWSQKLSCASTVCPSWICRCHHEELWVPHCL